MSAVKQLIQQGRLEQAAGALARYHLNHQATLQSLFLKATIEFEDGRYDDALVSVDAALKLSAGQPQLLILKAKVFLQQGHFFRAYQAISPLIQKRSLLFKDWMTLGHLLHQLNQYTNSVFCFEKAYELEPNHPDALFNYATALRNTGNLSAAKSKLEKLLQLFPTHLEGVQALTLMTNFSHCDAQTKTLATLIDHKMAKSSTQQFCLAKVYEDQNLWCESQQALTTANKMQRAKLNYDVRQDLDAIDSIMATFNQAQVNWPPQQSTIDGSNGDSQPLFITGLPRTGTSLLEQLLCRHSAISSAGELHQFAGAITQSMKRNQLNPQNKSQFIEFAATLNPVEIANTYRSNTQMFDSPEGYLIDKMPVNYLYIGLIQAAMPKAKIVHLTRSPMAAAYAIYKTQFNHAYPFASDLLELAQYYVRYRRLIDHWLRQNKTNILLLSYESLVQQPEQNIEHVCRWLGLANNEATLQQQPTPSATASSAQVREEVYTSSVSKWREVQDMLAPFSSYLLENGIQADKW